MLRFGETIKRFDKLCNVLEFLMKNTNEEKATRVLQEIKKILQYGKLFIFEHRITDMGREGLTDSSAHEFHLPFQEMIVVDPDSIIIVKDIENDSMGIKAKRFFVDYLRITPDSLDHNAMHCITSGYCIDAYIDIESSRFIAKEIDESYNWISDGKNVMQFDSDNNIEHMKEIMTDYVQNILTAMEEIALLNSQSNFVLEVSPKKIREPKRDKIPRSHERKQYTLLSPSAIRETMRIDGKAEEGIKISGHERRGHYRTLRSEVFKHRKGDRIWINPVWVGPNESVIGGKTYKVRLDV